MSLLNWIKNALQQDVPNNPAVFELPGEAGQLLAALRHVIDPEVGSDIVSMGLVRGLELDGAAARLRMTLTTPGCPMAGYLLSEVEQVFAAFGIEVDIDLEFEPPWSPAHMSDQGRADVEAGE